MLLVDLILTPTWARTGRGSGIAGGFAKSAGWRAGRCAAPWAVAVAAGHAHGVPAPLG
jgi:hypothetical protein